MNDTARQEDPPSGLIVSLPAWSLAEDGRVLRTGDTYRSWLVLVEAEREVRPAERLQRVRGSATPLTEWPGRSLGRHSVRVDANGAVLYWDAPTPVEGPVDLEAWVEGNLSDAPPDVPMNEGTVRRVRLEWCESVRTGPTEGTVLIDRARYDEVATSSHATSELNGDGPLLTAVLVELEIAPPSDRPQKQRASPVHGVRQSSESAVGTLARNRSVTYSFAYRRSPG